MLHLGGHYLEVRMIRESGPWKDALLADAAVMERWASKPNATSRRSLLIEREVFLAAYTIRKLWEAQKLSTSFRDRSLRCITYPAISDRITHLNNHELDKLYDFECPEEKTIVVRDLLDLIIHSFAFCECLRDDMTTEGFLVSSDRKRYDRVWFVEMDAFISLMRQVGTDYPSSMTGAFNRDKNHWELWQGHGDPPAEFGRHNEEIFRDHLIACAPSNKRGKGR